MSTSKIGKKFSLEHRKALSESRKRQYANGERKLPNNVGRKHSPETLKKMSEAQLTRSRAACKYCGKFCAVNVINRWHNDNCKEHIIAKTKMGY